MDAFMCKVAAVKGVVIVTRPPLSIMQFQVAFVDVVTVF